MLHCHCSSDLLREFFCFTHTHVMQSYFAFCLTLSFVSERHVHVRYLLSPVRLSSVTFVRPTQAVQIFRNISTALGTLAIR